MKILFIARTYPPLIGGMEKFAYDFYENMKPLVDLRLHANYKGKRNLLGFSLQTILFLVQHAKDFDIIHFSDATLSFMFPFIKIFSKSRITLTVHGLDLIYKKYGYQYLLSNFIRLADKIFPVSNATKEKCLMLNIRDDHLEIIPNGLDLTMMTPLPNYAESFHEKFGINIEGKKILVTIGRLIERKGHQWFIENVFPKLPEDYVYIIGGQGPLYDRIQMSILSQKLDSRVRLLGSISESEKDYLYRISDFFVMPNIHVPNDMEGFGIVTIEAGWYGVPVIATNIEGIRDAVIPGVSGILVNQDDPQAFVKAITETELDSEKIRNAIREKYDWSVIAEKYFHEFQLVESRTNSKVAYVQD